MKIVVEVIAVKGPALESPVEVDRKFEMTLPEGVSGIAAELLIEEEAKRVSKEAGAMLVWYGWEFAKEKTT